MVFLLLFHESVFFFVLFGFFFFGFRSLVRWFFKILKCHTHRILVAVADNSYYVRMVCYCYCYVANMTLALALAFAFALVYNVEANMVVVIAIAMVMAASAVMILVLALVHIFHYYNPFDYRLIKMASYKLHTFVAYTYFGMCTNHRPNHLHSIH